jgi:hypothetical protein
MPTRYICRLTHTLPFQLLPVPFHCLSHTCVVRDRASYTSTGPKSAASSFPASHSSPRPLRFQHRIQVQVQAPVLSDSNLNSNATFPLFFRFLQYRLLSTSSNSILRHFTDIFQLLRHFFLPCKSHLYLKIHPSALQISHRSVAPLTQVRGSAFPASHSSPSASLKRRQPQL